MIARRHIVSLGLSQFICWGTSYYLIGVFGDAIAADLGWSITLVHSGFSGALVVMGLTSGFVGRMIDDHGGRVVMTAGSVLLAIGCVGLGRSYDLISYNLSWACLGLAMRMTLYEAAFATLAGLGGRSARRPMSQVTLLGGLASTAFWPLGHALEDALGWRGAVSVFGLLALTTAALHWSLPRHALMQASAAQTNEVPSRTHDRGGRMLAAALYVTMVTAAAFLNSGMSAHMIGILAGLGIGAGAAVWLSTLRGLGQSGARLCEVVFGARLSEVSLGVVASAALPLSFLLGLFNGGSLFAGIAFTLAYGAGNGLLTIVRGTLPLVLFDPRAYGALTGKLQAPGFYVAALAPVVYAATIQAAGPTAALYLSLALGCLILACTLLLFRFFRKARHTEG